MRIIDAALFSFLGLAVASCSGKSPWGYDYIAASDKYDSSRITYCNQEGVCSYSFEILKVNDHLYGTFSFFTGKISRPDIRLTIGSEEYMVQGTVHEGGQRVALPPDALDLIIAALQSQKPVIAEIGNYKLSLAPNYFAEHYQKLVNKNPFYERAFKEIKERVH